MLSEFYVGTDGYDIGGMALFFGILGSCSFERTLHRHSSTIHRVILDECSKILEEAGEIKSHVIVVSYDVGWRKIQLEEYMILFQVIIL